MAVAVCSRTRTDLGKHDVGVEERYALQLCAGAARLRAHGRERPHARSPSKEWYRECVILSAAHSATARDRSGLVVSAATPRVTRPPRTDQLGHHDRNLRRQGRHGRACTQRTAHHDGQNHLDVTGHLDLRGGARAHRSSSKTSPQHGVRTTIAVSETVRRETPPKKAPAVISASTPGPRTEYAVGHNQIAPGRRGEERYQGQSCSRGQTCRAKPARSGALRRPRQHGSPRCSRGMAGGACR
jgi:hypothetical protein